MIAYCEIYKNPTRNGCVNFFKNKGFDVIKAILKREDAKNVCQILNICKNKKEDIENQQFLGNILLISFKIN